MLGSKFIELKGGRTRCGEPFCSGYAETSSLILYAMHVRALKDIERKI